MGTELIWHQRKLENDEKAWCCRPDGYYEVAAILPTVNSLNNCSILKSFFTNCVHLQIWWPHQIGNPPKPDNMFEWKNSWVGKSDIYVMGPNNAFIHIEHGDVAIIEPLTIGFKVHFRRGRGNSAKTQDDDTIDFDRRGRCKGSPKLKFHTMTEAKEFCQWVADGCPKVK